MTLEFCEDSANQGIAYSEVRYCPHLLANTFDKPEFTSKGDISPDEVVQIVNAALAEGEKKYDIKVRSIMCCMRHRPGTKCANDICLQAIPFIIGISRIRLLVKCRSVVEHLQGSHLSGDLKFHVFSRLFPVRAMKSQVNLASNQSVSVDNLDIT